MIDKAHTPICPNEINRRELPAKRTLHYLVAPMQACPASCMIIWYFLEVMH